MKKELIPINDQSILDTTNGKIEIRDYKLLLEQRKTMVEEAKENIFTIEKATFEAKKEWEEFIKKEPETKKDENDFIDEKIDEQFKAFKKVKSSFNAEIKGSAKKDNPILGLQKLASNIKQKYMKPFETFQVQVKELTEINTLFVKDCDKVIEEFELKQKTKKKARVEKQFADRNTIAELTFEMVEQDKFYLSATNQKYITDAMEDKIADIEKTIQIYKTDDVNGKRNIALYKEFNFDQEKVIEEISRLSKEAMKKKEIEDAAVEEERKKVQKEQIEKEQKIATLAEEKTEAKVEKEKPARSVGSYSSHATIQKATTEICNLKIEAKIGTIDKLMEVMENNPNIISIKKENNE